VEVALYFERIRTRLGVADIQVFRLILFFQLICCLFEATKQK